MPKNIEFKARSKDTAQLENLLLQLQPVFIGEDHQVDTYFHVSRGRLKLREGLIENALIHYERSDDAGAKLSEVLLYQHQPEPVLKQILTRSLGVKTIVDKKRRIYFIDQVKFHFDTVTDLGSFVEVEAIDRNDTLPESYLKEQCDKYIALFGLKKEDFIAVSYSDLLLAKKSSTL